MSSFPTLARTSTLSLCGLLLACSVIALAEEDLVRDTLNEVPEDVRVFNEHVTVLASPWMGGRLPGTKGMEYAKDYTEYWFRQSGVEPGHIDKDTGERSYRQPFPMGSNTELIDQSFSVNTDQGAVDFQLDEDYVFTGMGGSGEIEGPVVFVGYSIKDGPDGYESFDEDTDLSGKVAMMLRFEPMNEEGSSRWQDGRWSRKAGFAHKFRTLAERNPAAVILVNPPGADDPRVNALIGQGSNVIEDVPVFMMSSEGAEKMVAAMDPEGRSLMDLRKMADEGTALVEFNGTFNGSGTLKETPLFAENVMALLPGRGGLENEYIIIGGHLDHLGNGDFGSRRGAGALHPGADDNASGSVAVFMLAESLKKAYDEAPEDQPLRSILFACFSAEESGLNGSRYYVREPTYPLEDTSLMINFDMIGRITNDRLSVSGTSTGVGMEEWAQPFYDASELDIVASSARGGGSDHASFMREGVPVLFGIIADFHDDYHTPDDTVDKLNRSGAVKTIHLFHNLAFDAAQRPEKFAFQSSNPSGGEGENRRPGPARPRALKVRLGIRSQALPDDMGLRVISVTKDSSAANAGLQPEDIIKKWDKQPMKSRADLVASLAELSPGDKVQALIERDGVKKTLFITMKAPG
ncbi:MAG: M28 family peptidase [Phycisphaerales bacterium]|nr:M28 family peptidase [Phycisphaerales bacterium]